MFTSCLRLSICYHPNFYVDITLDINISSGFYFMMDGVLIKLKPDPSNYFYIVIQIKILFQNVVK
jgi:hypothetical protein